MKEANIAPFYACLYPALCDVARSQGYALAIHGSVVTDLDLIAIPWTDAAVDDETLIAALFERINALDYRRLLRRDCEWFTDEQVEQIAAQSDENKAWHPKPHGRKAWNLYLHFGAKVDVSVMPRIASELAKAGTTNAEL